MHIAHPPGARRSGIIINPSNRMAWRPNAYLIDGELDNRTPAKVTGWMRFHHPGNTPLKVTFDLAGDFHEDIRGKVIRFENTKPLDKDQMYGDNYMDGFSPVQKGTVGDITAGLPLGTWTEELAQKFMKQNELFWDESGLQGIGREARRQHFAEIYQAHIRAKDTYFPYVDYPYIEWYADNGRVVLELDPSQMKIFDIQGVIPRKEKSPKELLAAKQKRDQAFGNFMSGMVEGLSKENRKKGGDGNVTGIVVG